MTDISQLIDPISGQAFGSSVVKTDHDKDVEFRFPIKPYQKQYQKELAGLLDLKKVKAKTSIRSHQVKKNIEPLKGVKNIIAVASGKGGVGKSTMSVMLAKSLQNLGASVGILDADIYGPSIPKMLGRHEKPQTPDNNSFLPVDADGIQSMSLGYILDEKDPAIWRGAMVTKALMQLIGDTRWHDLDYLIMDLPPGTGDIQLTMIQKIPVTAAVIVTTPQDISLIDAQKALAMFNKVDIPVLGVIENMSTFICENCGHETPLFGQHGGTKMAKEFNIDLLGQVPLNISIREHMDSGQPKNVWGKKKSHTELGQMIALRTAQNLAKQPLLLKSGFSLKLNTI
ncbi:iron-sulfur cluster carrier protein ApbC [Marinicella gelatinilytica]|uniref:iron-sulfur cluster carrier protein ApbC n=1 Tax=Marinicella gelatinilytica TaxID=2996017 RepID=UPI00226094B4|nr:iron-sulfur cluster carrier protein ApbC [Marinicella gelatinilytica]MCX7545547.1 iron-sulfur cluster carrier protein ApbC [Marinicella gelatinilytica]